MLYTKFNNIIVGANHFFSKYYIYIYLIWLDNNELEPSETMLTHCKYALWRGKGD